MRSSRSFSAAQRSSSTRRRPPIRSRIRSGSRTHCSTTRSTPRGRSPSCITATRSPDSDIKYVFPHAGGTIPFVASRFAIVDAMNVIPGAEERAVHRQLPRLYWDTASAFNDPVLHLLRSVTGLDNVVFGTDYPYPRDASRSGSPAVDATSSRCERDSSAARRPCSRGWRRSRPESPGSGDDASPARWRRSGCELST